MYQKMLVPLDGSELAEVVFAYAKAFAARRGLDVVLLHVSDPEGRGLLPMRRAYIEHAAEIVRRETRRTQRRSGVKPEGRAVRVKGEVVEGYPPEEILRYAEENAIDLILMATHGRSGISRWTIGSVADKVLRASNIPVLLVAAGVPEEIIYDQWPKRTLMVPLDGSKLAESVLPHVETLVKQRIPQIDEVVLLRVCEPPAVPAYSEGGIPLNWAQHEQEEMARERRAAAQYLTGVEKRLKDMGINARSVVAVGKAADEIISYVSKNPFNLIVMATHGRSGLGRLVFGSVAQNVLQAVTSPILMIRPG